MIKIWGRNTSVNVQKVMWALGEVGVPHERIDVGGSFGKNNEPAYLAMNPNGLVPTLEEDGFLLWESNSIVRYLAAKHADCLFAVTGCRVKPHCCPVKVTLLRGCPVEKSIGAAEGDLKGARA